MIEVQIKTAYHLMIGQGFPSILAFIFASLPNKMLTFSRGVTNSGSLDSERVRFKVAIYIILIYII